MKISKLSKRLIFLKLNPEPELNLESLVNSMIINFKEERKQGNYGLYNFENNYYLNSVI